MDEDDILKAVEDVKNSEDVVEEVFDLLTLDTANIPPLSYIPSIGLLVAEVLKKLPAHKGKKSDYSEWLTGCVKRGTKALEQLCSLNCGKELRSAAFKALMELIPFYNDAFNVKPTFPIEEYARLVRLIMSSEGDVSCFLAHLKEVLNYEDMNKNVWKAIDAVTDINRPLVVRELRHLLRLIGSVDELKDSEGPKLYYSRVKVGVLNPKETDKCLRRIWERLSRVEMQSDVKQLMLLALLEKMMPRMIKPIFLTDYFMICLDEGGAIGVLSLQGIFDLIQKYNMNYPDIYGKLYSMFIPDLFQTTYKSRFYHLADLFMSSTMLPEALVAGFIKRLARLALVAPPADVIVLLAMITNLLIRHSNLQILLSRPGVDDFESDPYLPGEPNPSESRALESCLWEVKLLQDHVLPTVANAASFINVELPSIEKDLSFLLENKTQNIFEKEMNIRVPEPPLSFERPTTTFLNKPAVLQAFSAWE